MGLQEDVTAIVADRPGTFGVYARNLLTGETVGFNEDLVLPTESAAKTFILVHYERAVDRGEVDPRQRVTIEPEHVAAGSGVLRYLEPGLRPTLDDLAWLMIIVSDNTATGMVLEAVGGADAVNGTMQELGLATAWMNPKFSHARMVEEVENMEPFGTSTARDLAEVYTHIGERARRMLFRQQFVDYLPRRLPHANQTTDFGFSMPVRVYNKTGGGFLICTDSARFETDTVSWVAAAMAKDQQDLAMRPEDAAPSAFAEIGARLYEEWGT
jgi:beta-lactamase class A